MSPDQTKFNPFYEIIASVKKTYNYKMLKN